MQIIKHVCSLFLVNGDTNHQRFVSKHSKNFGFEKHSAEKYHQYQTCKHGANTCHAEES